MDSTTNLYRALASLAYAIAKSDGNLQESERKAFMDIIRQDLGEDYWIAKDRFETLENETTPTIDNAYNNTLFVIKRNKEVFSDDMKNKFIRVIEHVADAYGGTVDSEDFIIKQFKQELRELGL